MGDTSHLSCLVFLCHVSMAAFAFFQCVTVGLKMITKGVEV
jgi:hypothetical protein